jgi:probable phosphoglycerate mutase
VRHGESEWNRDHRIQGQLDPPLSDRGREQASRLARRLAARHVEALYASDLTRTLETAEPIAAAIGVSVQPLAELREIFLGEWEGLHTAELAERFPDAWAAWTDEPNWDLVPGGEGAAAFEARVGSVLDGLMERHPHGDAVVVTHGGVIQLALHRIVGKPSRGLFPFRISNASITVIERRDGRLIIAGVNDVSHLGDGADRPIGPA